MKNELSNEIKIEVSVGKKQVIVVIEDEQLQDLFESNDIKPSKNKIKELKELLVTSNGVEELLEQSLMEVIEELIVEEWGE